jgi:hypothetical protein
MGIPHRVGFAGNAHLVLYVIGFRGQGSHRRARSLRLPARDVPSPEERVEVQSLAFTGIVESHPQIAISGQLPLMQCGSPAIKYKAWIFIACGPSPETALPSAWFIEY